MIRFVNTPAANVPTPPTDRTTLFVDDTGQPSFKDDTGTVWMFSGEAVPKGYIDGCRPTYVSGTQVGVTAGTLYIPSLDRALEVPAPIISTPTLSASTWYYGYVFLSGSTPSVEWVTTAPSAPYTGTARTKTGDTSRRYIGAIKTNSSSAIIAFDFLPSDLMFYRIPPASFSDFQILAGGTATTPTTLNCAAYIPESSSMGYFQLQINAGTLTNLMPAGLSPPPVADLIVTKGAGIGIYTGPCRMGASSTVAYQANDSSSTTFIWIKGYYQER